MHSFYILENTSSFENYYTNYSKSFTEAACFDTNASDFNVTDPLGLDLDLYTFEFLDIYSAQNSSLVPPGHVGSIVYTVIVGTGAIQGPKLVLSSTTIRF